MGWRYNWRLSERIAEKYAHLFEVKGCYENVFRLVTEVPELRPSAELEILFCYMPGAAGYHYRHAFCLYDGRIVEPLLHLNMQDKNLNDIVPIRLMDTQEYHRLIVEDGRYDLWRALRDDGIQAFNNSKMTLNPVDLADLVSSATNTPDSFLLLIQNAMSGKGIHVPGSAQHQNGGLTTVDIYNKKGFADRNEYIKALAKQHHLDHRNVRIWAHLLGPDKDFTELPQLCEQKAAELANAPDPYRARGCNNRADYLNTVAAEFELDADEVERIAAELGPEQDFDGLLAHLQEAHDILYGKMYPEPENDGPEDDCGEDLEP